MHWLPCWGVRPGPKRVAGGGRFWGAFGAGLSLVYPSCSYNDCDTVAMLWIYFCRKRWGIWSSKFGDRPSVWWWNRQKFAASSNFSSPVRSSSHQQSRWDRIIEIDRRTWETIHIYDSMIAIRSISTSEIGPSTSNQPDRIRSRRPLSEPCPFWRRTTQWLFWASWHGVLA